GGTTRSSPRDMEARPYPPYADVRSQAFAPSEYCAAVQQTQIRLNRNRRAKISSQFSFGCFASRALRFSAAVDVLTFSGLIFFRLLPTSLRTSKINNARSRPAA